MKTATLLPSCVVQECGTGKIVNDCEERRALPCLYGLAGMLAHTSVWVAALLSLLVQEQAKGKKEVFFLPSCCYVRFKPTCPREPGTRAGARDGCEACTACYC